MNFKKYLLRWLPQHLSHFALPLFWLGLLLTAIALSSQSSFGTSILGNIGVLVLPDQKAIGNAHQAFDDNGNLQDQSQQTAIAQLGSKLAAVTAKLNM